MVFLGAVALIGGGCLGPDVAVSAGLGVAQAGTTAFIGGELLRAYKVPLDRMTEATRAAIASLELRAGTERPGDRSFFFLSRELKGREIAIRLEALSPAVTKLKIRVGILGDQAVSELIKHEIEEHLGMNGAPEAPPGTPGA